MSATANENRPGQRASAGWRALAALITVELWALAVPAFLAACALVWLVGSGWPRASLLTWLLNSVLLIAWCVFTGVIDVNIDFSATNSHWMWLAGLFTASGGGLIGLVLARPRPRA